jgi:hypothetical protein
MIPSEDWTPENEFAARTLFNALGGGTRPWLDAVHRIKGKGMTGRGVDDSHNLVWNLTYLETMTYKNQDVLHKDLEFPNHTWKFTDELPQGGDEANTVYVMFNKNASKSGGEEDGFFYFNSMLQYDADENVYYRYLMQDITNPDKSILFQELVLSNVQGEKGKDSDFRIKCSMSLGNAITFANVIVQYVEMEWPGGDETPYPFMTGTGNADYFMGGQHFAGVWERTDINSRTVFYGADGNEIELQRGKTLIILMDYSEKHSKGKGQCGIKYE